MKVNEVINNNNLKISVIIPTFNEEKHIGKLIESLLNQTYLPDEIIISDAGSSDQTLNIISNYSKKNKFIKIIKRKGICRGSGRNEGIFNAKNDLLALIDSGMIPDKDWLHSFSIHLKTKKSYDVIFGSVSFFVNKGIEKSYASTFMDKRKKLNYIDTSVASMLIRKEIWRKVGRFPESQDGSYIVEDLDFIKKINDSKSYKIHESKARVYWIMDFNILKIIKRYYEYSIGSLKAGYFGKWHKGLIRNIIALIFLFIASVKFSSYFLFIILILFLMKSYSYLKLSKWFVEEGVFSKIIYLFQTSFIFLIIDISSFVGIIRWLFLGSPKVKN